MHSEMRGGRQGEVRVSLNVMRLYYHVNIHPQISKIRIHVCVMRHGDMEVSEDSNKQMFLTHIV